MQVRTILGQQIGQQTEANAIQRVIPTKKHIEGGPPQSGLELLQGLTETQQCLATVTMEIISAWSELT